MPRHIRPTKVVRVIGKTHAAFARNVKAVRELKGITQRSLAESLDVDRVCVANVEGCRYCPTADTIDRFAQALGVKPEQLVAPKVDWEKILGTSKAAAR